MKRWFQISVCLLAALHLIGGQWGLLQMVAWAQMLRDYSESKSVVVAVKETFDGEHPCSMCLKIKEGRQKEGKENPLPQSKAEKPTAWLASSFAVDLPSLFCQEDAGRQAFASSPDIVSQWATSPPTPPPRSGVASKI